MTTKTTPAKPSLKIERVFDATPEKLWSFWTDPKKYAKWFNPAPIDLVIHAYDVRVGGRVKFDMPQPDGNANTQEGVFHSLTPHSEIVTGAPDKSFLITVRFVPVDANRTRMSVEVVGVPAEFHGMATMGWNAGLDKLEGEIAGRVPHAVGRTYAPLFTMERTFRAPVEKLWTLWTTKEGLEKWYWPEGLVAENVRVDLRVGGGFEIGAVGLPHTSRGTYVEIVPNRRLGILNKIDFVSDVEPYWRIDSIDFLAVPGGTRLLVSGTRMHDESWQAASVSGFTSSLDKLERALAGDVPDVPSSRQGFTIVREFKASPEQVWKMWTTKAGLERWFRGPNMTTTVTDLDVRIQGRYALEMKDATNTLVNHGTYIDVVPNRHLAMVWEFDIFLAPGQRPYGIPISVDFERLPNGGTKMTFTQGPLATSEHTEGSRQGVLANFARLAKALGE